MKGKIVNTVIFCAFGILIGVVYARNIIPALVNYPLRHDIAQDYIGARALIHHNEELYPMLATAFDKMGVPWEAYHRSTHPPTAFLFVLPLTLFGYPTALAIWMVSMFLCIVLTARAFDLTWKTSFLAALLSLAWPPAIWALGQFTPIWMLGLALAYRYRHKPFLSGLFIGLASLPKYFAAVALIHPIRRQRWSALITFAGVWLAALGALLLLRTDSISAYVASNVGNSVDQILRPDNGAMAVVAWRLGGWPGIAAVVILTLCVFWISLRSDNPAARSDNPAARSKSPAAWACLVWLGIALLPIAWGYSLLPLLPWLIMTLRSTNRVVRAMAVIALALPYLSEAWLPISNPWFVALSIVFAGFAFALAASANETQSAKIKR